MKLQIKMLLLCLAVAFLSSTAFGSADSLSEKIKSLEPIIGGFPPQLKDDKEKIAVTKKYKQIKSKLDSLLAKDPDDHNLLFMRGHLQSMGHNMDFPEAWEGSTSDLKKILDKNPGNVPAILELAGLWINSRPDLAASAEGLFRGAQCYHGVQPLEEAQSGVYFALYYQGKMKEAYVQSQYLTKTWPQNELYRKLNQTTQSVLERTKQSSSIKISPDSVAMATCK